MDDDRLTCVICDGRYNDLAPHARMQHKITAKHYRELARLDPHAILKSPSLQARNLVTLAQARALNPLNRAANGTFAHAEDKTTRPPGPPEFANLLAALDLVVEEAQALKRLFGLVRN